MNFLLELLILCSGERVWRRKHLCVCVCVSVCAKPLLARRWGCFLIQKWQPSSARWLTHAPCCVTHTHTRAHTLPGICMWQHQLSQRVSSPLLAMNLSDPATHTYTNKPHARQHIRCKHVSVSPTGS